jgi:3-hydroxyacyl-CoA dehydrogenase
VTDLVLEFARRIGQVPIELRREHDGYVFNALFNAVNREAITMAEQGFYSYPQPAFARPGFTEGSKA